MVVSRFYRGILPQEIFRLSESLSYGDDLPIHVSFGPSHAQQIVCMVATPSVRQVPQVTSREKFLMQTKRL